jgi:hypothetical protein
MPSDNFQPPIVWTDEIYVTMEPKPLEFPLFAGVLLQDVRGNYELTRQALIMILEGRQRLGWAQNAEEPKDFYADLYRSLIPRADFSRRRRRP